MYGGLVGILCMGSILLKLKFCQSKFFLLEQKQNKYWFILW